MRTWLAGGAVVLALSGCTAVENGSGSAVPTPSASSVTPAPVPPAGSGLVPFRGDRFSVLLPGAPVRKDVPVKTAGGSVTVITHLLAVERDPAHLYGIGYVDYPAGLPLSLDGAVRGAADKVSGRVLADRRLSYRGAPGRDIRVRSSRGFTVFARLLLVDRRMYTIEVVVQPDSTTPPALFGSIVQSLRF